MQKINQKNTWELDLIDHLTEIIRAEEDNDVETNFQMVSCAFYFHSYIVLFGFKSYWNFRFNVDFGNDMKPLSKSVTFIGEGQSSILKKTIVEELLSNHHTLGFSLYQCLRDSLV